MVELVVKFMVESKFKSNLEPVSLYLVLLLVGIKLVCGYFKPKFEVIREFKSKFELVSF